VSLVDRPVIRRPGQNAVVFGLKGSGKTYLVRRLLLHHPRVLIVDPHREYGSVAVEVSSPQELTDYLEGTAGRWRIAYFNTHLEDDFELLTRAAWSIGNLLFVVEEVDRFCSPTWISDSFFQIVNYGRHAPGGELAGSRPVDYLAVSRTPADVHRSLTRQAYEIYCFTIAEPRDIDYLSRWVSRDFAEGLSTLPPQHHRFMDLYNRLKGWRDLTPREAPGVDHPDADEADADEGDRV